MRKVIILSIVLLTALPAPARVAPTTLHAMTTHATDIVLARVDRILDVAGVRVAVLSVEESWKGSNDREIALFAESTWTCDLTGAALGERALFFLIPYEFDPEPSPEPRAVARADTLFKEPASFRPDFGALGLGTLMWNASYGRGRMPVRAVNGRDYVTLRVGEVALPAGVPTIDGPETYATEFIRSIRLDDARAMVQDWVAKND